jgi:iron complex outermembrane receptor protein
MTASHFVRKSSTQALALGVLAALGAGPAAALGHPPAAAPPHAGGPASGAAQGTAPQAPAAGAKPAQPSILLAQAVTPAPAGSEPAPAQLQTVVVTGSLIRRTSIETPSPVQVLSLADLQNTGLTSVGDVLRTLSANGAGTLSQSFNNAFAGGGAGVALRGLTVGGTLTLIDGHRMVSYPLTDDGERQFVDVSDIPFVAVERVEVLKDGASSEYGSDAIAGVVNVILRKTYEGAQVDAEGGTSGHNDGTTEHVDAILGTGDPTSNGYNVYVAADFRHQDAIGFYSRHEQFSKLDYTDVGGVNTTPGAAPNSLTPFPQSITGYLIDPTTGGIGAFLPGCSAASQAANLCTFQDKGLQLQPRTTQEDILSKLTVNLGENWQTVSTASVFRSLSDQAADSYLGLFDNSQATEVTSGFSPIGLPPGGLPNVKIYNPITVPAGYPGNPYGVPATLVYDFTELGFPQTTFQTNTYRFVQELNGTLGGWDVSASAGYMYSILEQDAATFNIARLQTALNDGYALGSPNGSALFGASAKATDASYLYYGSAHGTRTLMRLPGGKMALGLGAEWFEQKLNATAAPESLNATDAFLNDAWAIGSEADSAAFAELDVTAFHRLEVDLAGRYDHYNTNAGGRFDPKIGVKYTPVRMLALRGTWTKGFRAPSIAEEHSGAAFAASTAPDPILCPTGGPTAPGSFPSQCSVAIVGVQSGNPSLKPETTTTYTLGAIIDPSQAFNVSLDYYDIKINRDIISAFEAGGLGFTVPNQLLRLGPLVTLPQVQPDGTLANVTTPVPLITYETFPYINASQDETDGFDVDLRSRVDLGVAGRVTARLVWTHMLSYKLEANGSTYQLAGTHGPSGVSGDTGNPKDRATLTLGWSKGPLSTTATVYYTGSYSITDPSASQSTCAEALYSNFTLEFGNKFPAGSPFPGSYCSVAHFTDVDLYSQYQLTGHLAIHVAVNNLFDAQAPFDAVTYGGGGGAAYSAALSQAGAVGRFYLLGATYRW